MAGYLTGNDPRRELAVQIRMAAAYERSMQVTVERELARANDAAAQAIEARGMLEVVFSEHQRRMRQIYSATYRQVMPVFGDRILNAAAKSWRTHLRRKDARGDFERFIEAFLARLGARAVVVATTTQEQIRAAIAAADAAGMGQEELASQIRRGVPDLQGINWWTPRVRSLVIARTEVHTASTTASDAAARATGVVEMKEWGAAEDSRTRPDHAEADGQVVGLDDAFQVGPHNLMFPGEFGAPASTVVNCRCVALYRTTD